MHLSRSPRNAAARICCNLNAKPQMKTHTHTHNWITRRCHRSCCICTPFHRRRFPRDIEIMVGFLTRARERAARARDYFGTNFGFVAWHQHQQGTQQIYGHGGGGGVHEEKRRPECRPKLARFVRRAKGLRSCDADCTKIYAQHCERVVSVCVPRDYVRCTSETIIWCVCV